MGWRIRRRYHLPLEEISVHLQEGDGYPNQKDFIWTILQSIGTSQNGWVKAEEYEEKKRVYERLNEEMNDKWRAVEKRNRLIGKYICQLDILSWEF